MGHPTMQENDTAKLTPTITKIVKHEQVKYVHIVFYYDIP